MFDPIDSNLRDCLRQPLAHTDSAELGEVLDAELGDVEPPIADFSEADLFPLDEARLFEDPEAELGTEEEQIEQELYELFERLWGVPGMVSLRGAVAGRLL